MKFALVDNIKTEATVSGAKGKCPYCGSPVHARCGEIKVNHWSHNRKRNCDPWWENETEWHRLWKNNFPEDWQETNFTDGRTGEKHIADVYSSHGLVIEFQHSHIDPQELTKRENFYKNMVWVVDGTRLKRDYPRFIKGREEFYETTMQDIFSIEFPDECFPAAWLGSSVPVVFDFQGTESLEDQNDVRNKLYCLFPIKVIGFALVAEIKRSAFIKTAINGEWSVRTRNYMDELRLKEKQRKNQIANQLFKKYMSSKKRGSTQHYDPQTGLFFKK